MVRATRPEMTEQQLRTPNSSHTQPTSAGSQRTCTSPSGPTWWDGWLAGWLVGWPVEWLSGCFVGWLGGCVIGFCWLVAWVGEWLLVGCAGAWAKPSCQMRVRRQMRTRQMACVRDWPRTGWHTAAKCEHAQWLACVIGLARVGKPKGNANALNGLRP